jgi:hypothetical protein
MEEASCGSQDATRVVAQLMMLMTDYVIGRETTPNLLQ